MMPRNLLLIFVILGAFSWAYLVQMTWLKVNDAYIGEIHQAGRP